MPCWEIRGRGRGWICLWSSPSGWKDWQGRLGQGPGGDRPVGIRGSGGGGSCREAAGGMMGPGGCSRSREELVCWLADAECSYLPSPVLGVSHLILTRTCQPPWLISLGSSDETAGAWWDWGCSRITSTKQQVLVAQSCLTLYKPMDCSLPRFSVNGILQARILEWVTIPFSGGASWPRGQTQVSCLAGGFFIVWATREAPISKLRVGGINRSQWLFQSVGAGVG